MLTKVTAQSLKSDKVIEVYLFTVYRCKKMHEQAKQEARNG